MTGVPLHTRRGSPTAGVCVYDTNLRAPFAHSHKEQEEAYVVVAGGGRVLLDSDVVELKLWDVVRVAPDVVRAFEAGPDGMELIAVGGPKPEGGDACVEKPCGLARAEHRRRFALRCRRGGTR
jgi:mannose-6-phosphate isomerase-like protein (cupin superfamily)